MTHCSSLHVYYHYKKTLPAFVDHVSNASSCSTIIHIIFVSDQDIQGNSVGVLTTTIIYASISTIT